MAVSERGKKERRWKGWVCLRGAMFQGSYVVACVGKLKPCGELHANGTIAPMHETRVQPATEGMALDLLVPSLRNGCTALVM